jgi:hypothetical protein
MWVNGKFVDMGGIQFDPAYRFPRHVWQVLSKYFSSIDPNWADGHIDLDVHARPSYAVLNGPKYGNVIILEHIKKLFSGSLASGMKRFVKPKMPYILKFGNHLDFCNPDHKLEFIDGRTRVLFENCDIGIIRNYNSQNQSFDIYDRCFEGRIESSPDERGLCHSMTVDDLLSDFDLTDKGCMCCQAVTIDYLPPTA